MGKSTFIETYLSKEEKFNANEAMGFNINVKNISLHETRIALQIWEIDVFKKDIQFLLPGYLRGASGFIILLDLTRESSLEETEFIFEMLKSKVDPEGDIPKIIVGTKKDLKAEKMLSLDQVIKSLNIYKILDFRLSSVLIFEDISRIMLDLVEEMMKRAGFL